MLDSIPANEQPAVASALGAYLMSQRAPLKEPKASGANPVPLGFADRGDQVNGRKLFHSIGCVACHQPAEDFEPSVSGGAMVQQMLEETQPEELRRLGYSPSALRHTASVPLPQLSEKYSQRSLTYFLLDPLHTRPSGRMPSFGLKPVEAADIAAWLMVQSIGNLSAPTKPNTPRNSTFDRNAVEQGRRWFSELRCVNCHSLGKPIPVANIRPISKQMLRSATSCLDLLPDNQAQGEQAQIGSQNQTTKTSKATRRIKRGQPIFRIDSQQVAAIEAALSATPPVGSDTDPQAEMLKANCYACHERNQMGGLDLVRRNYFQNSASVDLGDEGRLPPDLTGVGSKLKLAWLEKVLGNGAAVRPYLTIRMPRYAPQTVKQLPTKLVHTDTQGKGVGRANDAFGQSDQSQLGLAGRQLAGIGCAQCHHFRGHFLPGVLGMDLEGVTERINPDWLREFLTNPASLKPRTRMPNFFPNGQSLSTEVLGGKVELQVAALIAYIKDLSNQPLPDTVEQARAASYELIPAERPIVLRTFMPMAGMQAIAVGMNSGIHYAFDSESLTLAQVWRGRFLDAQGTWFDRFAPPLSPLSADQIAIGNSPTLAMLPSLAAGWPKRPSDDAKFHGYRLDDLGQPILMYGIGACRVEERMAASAAAGDLGLLRSFEIRAVDPAHPQTGLLWLRAHSGKQLTELSSSQIPGATKAFTSNTGLTVALISQMASDTSELNSTGSLRPSAEGQEWLVPINTQSDWAVQLLYLWKSPVGK
jgi:cytochrome c2